MEVKIVNRDDSKMQLNCDINHPPNTKYMNLESKQIQFGLAYFEVQARSTRCHAKNVSRFDGNILISIRYTKMLKIDNLNYSCKVSSATLQLKPFIFTDTKNWHQICCYEKPEFGNNDTFSYSFDITIEIDLVYKNCPFAPLYDEEDSTDFEIKGKDGSVHVHKLLLKVCSPVLRGMLNGEWKESDEGKITVDFDKESLEIFKEYIYLNKLSENETDLKSLLLIGSYYMIPDLVLKCIFKLVIKINNNNIGDISEFAGKFKVRTLLGVIFKMVKDGYVEIEDYFENSIAYLNISDSNCSA